MAEVSVFIDLTVLFIIDLFLACFTREEGPKDPLLPEHNVAPKLFDVTVRTRPEQILNNLLPNLAIGAQII